MMSVDVNTTKDDETTADIHIGDPEKQMSLLKNNWNLSDTFQQNLESAKDSSSSTDWLLSYGNSSDLAPGRQSISSALSPKGDKSAVAPSDQLTFWPTMSEADIENLVRSYERCQEILNQTLPETGGPYCPPWWDTWGCWNYTKAGTVAEINCPSFVEAFDPNLKAYRECMPNGQWWMIPGTNKTWSNYSTCVNMDEVWKQQLVVKMYTAGFIVSIICLSFAMGIFLKFKSLRCTRVTIHMHLFTSYILTAIFFIIYYSVLEENILVENPIWCQAINVITQFLCLCNFAWMFCEGFYLHTVIVFAFTTGKKLMVICCIIGWCGPILPTILYTVLRATDKTARIRCWTYNSELNWVIFGPIIFLLLVNGVILCNVVRVLVTKMRATNSPYSRRTRKAVRAAIILIPLLGLQFVLFPVAPSPGSTADLVYRMISAFVTSFQGTFVALILCFFNGEVIETLRRRWDQRQIMNNSRSQLSRRSTFGVESQFENRGHRLSNKTEVMELNGQSGSGSRKGSTQKSALNFTAKNADEQLFEEESPALICYHDTEESLKPGPDEAEELSPQDTGKQNHFLEKVTIEN